MTQLPEEPRTSFFEEAIEGHEGPFIAASDYIQAVPEVISNWAPGGLYVLGTDGFGRSASRETLRRFFEVDAENIVVAALYELIGKNKCDGSCVAGAIKEFGIDPEAIDPRIARELV